MASELKPYVPPTDCRHRRRAAWRQRLVEAERGITQGFRGDSTLFGHLFVASVIVAAALVLSIPLVQWAVLILALSLVLAAEMFQHALKAIVLQIGSAPNEHAEKALRVGTAAVFVAITGATTIVVLLFGSRLLDMFSGS